MLTKTPRLKDSTRVNVLFCFKILSKKGFKDVYWVAISLFLWRVRIRVVHVHILPTLYGIIETLQADIK